MISGFVGTESESKDFMSVCVETIRHYPMKDQLSPVFIFERLCSIIYPVSARPHARSVVCLPLHGSHAPDLPQNTS